MNDIWSSYIQGTGTLFGSRALRFDDFFKEKYKNLFRIENCKKILEIGCGPGALALSLSRWYPDAEIYGVDRDSAFIKYARSLGSRVNFSEGDATELDYSDGTFDATISNTVSEHIEPSAFYSEQLRVLKDNGVCLVISSRKGITVKADIIAEETAFERDIWERTAKRHEEVFKKYNIRAYPQNESEIPKNMEKYGFRSVSCGYVVIDLAPDDPKYTKETAHAIINDERQNELENADALSRIAADCVTPIEISELKRLINERYDKRLTVYDSGQKLWDLYLSLMMIVRGIK